MNWTIFSLVAIASGIAGGIFWNKVVSLRLIAQIKMDLANKLSTEIAVRQLTVAKLKEENAKLYKEIKRLKDLEQKGNK